MKAFDLEIGSLDKCQIFRCLNYEEGITPNPAVLEIFDNLYEQVCNLEHIRGAYIIVPIVYAKKDHLLTDKGVIHSRRLAKIAVKSTSLAFCLVTAGNFFDQKAASSSDILEACLWDAFGTVVVEKAVDLLLGVLRKEEGIESSLPFSPGYCDWDLSGQQLIFSAFDSIPIGIHLLPDSFMMTPQKSIAFVSCLGVKSADSNPCKLCTLEKCFMRR